MNDEELRIHISQVKARRRDIDTQIQLMKKQPPSRETALAITNAEQSVMWLGMELKRVREEHPDSPSTTPPPYPGSKDPSSTGIEPTADGLKMAT